MITLDTSALVAVIDPRDDYHLAASAHFRKVSPPYIIPAGILGEIGFMIERVGAYKLGPLLLDLARGAYTLDCAERDFSRIRELVLRYDNLPLGFCDASAIACAERNGGRVMTFDRRDFDIVAREGTIVVEP